MEGDTTNATSILACAADCINARDDCCSFQFDRKHSEDEACSLNVACHPTRPHHDPSQLFCTRGIVDFKRSVGKTGTMTIVNQSFISGRICPDQYKPLNDQVGRPWTYENYKKLEQCAKNCTADNKCKGFRLNLNPAHQKKPFCNKKPRALDDPALGKGQLVCIKGIVI